MALTTAYMVSVKNLGPILDAIKDAGVPPRFTNEFLKSLGFSSSNDRAVINVLKGLGFLDQQGVPTELYRRFRDRTQSKSVLADAMKEAYSDLFLAHQKANELPSEKLKGFFATRTDKGDRVVEAMGATFRALSQRGDFAVTSERVPPKVERDGHRDPEQEPPAQHELRVPPRLDAEFHYNIQIHLPATRDIVVYNAIFKALRENLS